MRGKGYYSETLGTVLQKDGLIYSLIMRECFHPKILVFSVPVGITGNQGSYTYEV